MALAAFGQGEAQAKPDTPEQGADKVLAAWTAKDEAALKILAERLAPDPWLVADELCLRGEHDAAEAFARVAPPKHAGKLPDYVSAQRTEPSDAKLRDALRGANDALHGNDFPRVLALTESAEGRSVTGVRLLYARGLALAGGRQWKEAAAAFLAAAEAAQGLGWRERQARALSEAGRSSCAARRFREGLAAWERLRVVGEELGDQRRVAAALANIGNTYRCLGDSARAIETLNRALEVMEEVGNRADAATTLGMLGATHAGLGDPKRAIECFERSCGILEDLGDRAGVARTHANIGLIQLRVGDYRSALDHIERSRRIDEELGNRPGVARSLGILGSIHMELGDFPGALADQERALAILEGTGDREQIAITLGSIGNVHHSLGNYARALEFQKRSLAIREEIGDLSGVSVALGNMGIVHTSVGDYASALACMERARRIMEEIGDRQRLAAVLGNIGLLHMQLGDYARALDAQERSLEIEEATGDRAGIASSLGAIGLVHERLGDYPRALDYLERSRKLSEEIGNRPGVAQMLANLGSVHQASGDPQAAMEHMERAVALMEKLGDRGGVATSLANLALIHRASGDYRRALDCAGRALEMEEELGRRAGIAQALGTLGRIHESRGDYARAVDYRERALARARSVGDRETEVFSLWGLASAHLASGRHREAASFARQAVEALPALVRGLGEEQGARARQQWDGIFEVGARAAKALDDAAEAWFFLESGRAGSLLESLGGRDAVLSRAAPDALRKAEREARAREAGALRAHDLALRGGDREQIRARRKALDEARTHLEEVIARIRREAKAAASLLYGRVDSLGEMKGRLQEGEVLLLYGPEMALVVTREEARIVPLAELEGACEARDWARLEDLAVEPLGLDEKVKRILVSPVGALSYAPFCLLAPGREVVYVPSGTTYGLLLDEAAKKGDGVLALGDPDYGTRPDPGTLTVMRGGRDLVPLPATRAEAKSVGSTVLLGKDATEERLRAALAQNERWRALHLACHGLVDPERPLLSSLALSGGDLLTTMDVFRTAIPADLVVLSACETAKGKVYRAEGVVGFVRAFMFAGAPRVLVSLWKVDDEATRALMIKFYELWKSGDVTAAAALRAAQQHVRDQEKWRHPRYWAAWQLWGLPD